MGYQNFKISYSSMDQFYSVACTAINNWMEEINSLATAYTKMIELESFQATGAESAKAYLQEVHGVLLYSLQQVLTSYQTELLLYKKGYYDIDSNIYATIPEEIVLNVKNKLSNEATTLDTIAQSVESSISSVSDIVFVGIPTKYLLQATLDGLKENLNNYKTSVEQYETDQGNTYQTVLQEALDALQLTVSDYLYNGTNIASYQSGSISGNTYMLDLYEKVQKCSDQVESKREEIEEAVKFQTEVYEQMQADYEAACEARKDEGTANLIMGGVAVFVGAAAIICTAGMATPVVVTAAVAGGSTVVYGASNMAEGAQDLYYGSIGDLDSVAINPIRDTVFAGNQKLYDAWGSLNMTVAGLCVPVGQAVNGVAGSGTTVLAKTAIKTVGKEMAKDMVMDFASEQIVNYAAEKFSLNQTGTVLLNLGVSTLLDKGSEAIGDKITGSKGDPFTDKMTYEEAARYNEHWNSLENGVHDNVQNGFQGDLSDADPRSALEIEMTQLKADEIVSNMLSKSEVDVVPELKIEDPNVMKDVDIAGGEGDAGKSGSMAAKEIIRDRVQGFDLEEHPIKNKQLSSSKMKELKNKIDSRTATREEYNLYEWNKKMSQRRSEGVKDFWNQERERIIKGERTTRNWTQEQIDDILRGKTPKYNGKPIQGHHTYSVSKYPHLANKGEVIFPVTANEHLNGWHGGNYKNSLPGEPIVDFYDFD